MTKMGAVHHIATDIELGGRPPKSNKGARKKYLRVRLHDLEKEALELRAQALGYDELSEYVREKLLADILQAS